MKLNASNSKNELWAFGALGIDFFSLPGGLVLGPGHLASVTIVPGQHLKTHSKPRPRLQGY